MKTFKIAIDGPAGVGKSTAAKGIAKRLGILYLDTGAMFRALAIYFLDKGLDPEAEKNIESLLSDIDIDTEYRDGLQHMFLNGMDVTKRLRDKEISAIASVISQYPAVRKKVLKLEIKASENQSVVMEGRDIGTVVMPDADLKIFLTADKKERARRRYKELEKSGKLERNSLGEIEDELTRRDTRDSERDTAPLSIASNADIIDTTNLDVKDVQDQIIALLNEKL